MALDLEGDGQPSPTSTTPAFSPMPTIRSFFMDSETFWPNWRRYFFEDL
ncbi:hypothetical protein BC477_01120 [Clavibacter michiganensis subsp. michiganensis]|nr:hypothetical protein BC477_01120 [Clavibacter michiganensis subsp. michiganensis]